MPLLPGLPPVKSRQPRHAILPRWVIVVAGGIIFLVFTSWWTQRPLVRIPLPDGGELLLVEAHYGPTFNYTESGGLSKRIDYFLSDQARTKPESDVLHLGDPNGLPKLWLVFDGRHVKTSSPNGWFIDTIETMQSGLLIGGVERHMLNNSTARREVIEFTNYPRHSHQLQLRVVMDGKAVETTIPNPFPVSAVPSWTPEPIPQSRQFKNGEIVLKSLRRHPQEIHLAGASIPSFAVEPEIEVHEPGVSPAAFDIAHVFYDVTGNENVLRLPSGEPAWKIHATVWPNEKYPFPAAEVVSLGHTTMPGSGEFRVLPVPTNAAPGTGRYAVLAGSGEYRVQLAKELKFETVPVVYGPDNPFNGQNGIVECNRPELFILGSGAFPYAMPMTDVRQLHRAMIGTATIPIRASRSNIRGDGWMKGYRFDGAKDEAPPAGTEMEIQLIFAHAESVDFFVQPPQP